MSDLLDLAVDAHGGLNRWSKVETVTVAASVTGEIWKARNKLDYLKNVIFEVETKRERVIGDFPGQDKRSLFEPKRVEIRRRDGTIIASRDNPEASFRGQDQFTPWDDLHVAYFSGEAFYTYINTPFLFTYEGFHNEEIVPIHVGGETWRRLKVTFPETVKSHSRIQIFCFGPDGCCGGMTTMWTFLGLPLDSITPPIIVTSMGLSSQQNVECMRTRWSASL